MCCCYVLWIPYYIFSTSATVMVSFFCLSLRFHYNSNYKCHSVDAFFNNISCTPRSYRRGSLPLVQDDAVWIAWYGYLFRNVILYVEASLLLFEQLYESIWSTLVMTYGLFSFSRKRELGTTHVLLENLMHVLIVSGSLGTWHQNV